MKYGNAFPPFFDAERLLNPEDLPNSFVPVTKCTRVIRDAAQDVCRQEQYLPSAMVIERYFMDGENHLMGCQCVFFNAKTTLGDFEKDELRKGRTFNEFVNSMDPEVLLKIALVWNHGFAGEPELVLASPSMSNHQLLFLGEMLKTAIQLELQIHPTNFPHEIGDI